MNENLEERLAYLEERESRLSKVRANFDDVISYATASCPIHLAITMRDIHARFGAFLDQREIEIARERHALSEEEE